MKALTFNPYQDQFRIADMPVPKLGDSDVLVKVEACGLNPVDAKIGLWKSMAPDMNEKWVPGLDVSGHIVEIGEDVTGWRVSA
jgi:NADPH:quinone reductase-like Zn-dependent oxidoreductase